MLPASNGQFFWFHVLETARLCVRTIDIQQFRAAGDSREAAARVLFWIAVGDVVNRKLHAVTDQIHAAFIAP